MSSKTITIGSRRIVGAEKPCFIIAEIGSNHNQQFDIAKELINVCIDAGVDAVKFQSFKVENWISKDFKIPHEFSGVNKWKKFLKSTELSYELYAKISEYCVQRDIICFSTPSHKTDIDKLNKLDVPAFKFGSVQITDLPTIEYAAKLEKPIMLSAGASDMSEVLKAVEVVLDTGNNQLALLHCTTKYPCDNYELVNLNVLRSFQTMFDFPIGYSDHTPDPVIIPVAAVGMGAKIIEKHITLDRNMKGPDHPFALEPEEFSRMVEAIKLTEKALGSSYHRILPEEKESVKIGRRSLVTTRKMNIC